MNILGINYNPKINNTEKNALYYKATSKAFIPFEGALTRFAQKSPTISADLLQLKSEFYTRDKGIAGVFPSEFLKAIKKNLGAECCPQRIKECIEGVRATFAATAKILEKVEDKILQNQEKSISDMNLNNFLKELKENIQWKVLDDDSSDQIKLQNRIIKKHTPKKTFIKKIEIEAGKILEAGLKQNNIIPNDAKVIINRLDDGNTGTAYRIAFINKNHQKIFADKVIKYYKNMDAIFNNRFNAALKRFSIIKKNSDVITSKITKVFNLFSDKKFPKISAIKQNVMSEIEIFKKINFDEYKNLMLKKIQDQKEIYKSENGMHKEAVLANYTRKAIGHKLDSSDLIKLCYVDLNNKYAILDFSSLENLGPITKKNSYEPLGFNFTDIIEDVHNFVEGRLIDYGGYKITNTILAENPVARRIYKKIKHIEGKDATQKRIDRINVLYQQASQNKLSQSSEIILGLKEASKLIPEDKQKLLFFNI